MRREVADPACGRARGGARQERRVLGVMFVAGLGIRLVLAPVHGFAFDMQTFTSWAHRLATSGPRHFYEQRGVLSDYPPGYLYVLLVVGKVWRWLFGGVPPTMVIKVPAILADVGVAAVAIRLGAHLGAARGTARLIVAAAVLLNPAVIFVSSVWGQVDSVLALPLLGAVLLLGTGRPTFRREAAGVVLLAVALTVKPQAAFAIPVAIVLLLRRHLAGRLGGRRGAVRGAVRLAALGVLGAMVFLLVAAPFGLGPRQLAHLYGTTSREYPYISVFAFNVWGVVGFLRPDRAGHDAVRLLGVPAYWVGLAGFGVSLLVVLERLLRGLARAIPAPAVLLFGGSAGVCVAFATLTRMHERYLFLAVPLLAPLAASRAARWMLAALSALSLLNMWFVYGAPAGFTAGQSTSVAGFYGFLYGSGHSPQQRMYSIVTGAVALGVAFMGWRWLGRTRGNRDADQAAPAA